MKDLIVERLKERGVALERIAEVVYKLQRPYYEELKYEECLESVNRVLTKREVQYTILTGVALDKMTEAGKVEEPLASIIGRDEPLYGVDESLALAIASIYGTIGYTSFGYLDKDKFGIMKELDSDKSHVNTFMDDLVAGIAAAAAARIAHRIHAEEPEEQEEKEVS